MLKLQCRNTFIRDGCVITVFLMNVDSRKTCSYFSGWIQGAPSDEDLVSQVGFKQSVREDDKTRRWNSGSHYNGYVLFTSMSKALKRFHAMCSVISSKQIKFNANEGSSNLR